jgi:hypothetical protein
MTATTAAAPKAAALAAQAATAPPAAPAFIPSRYPFTYGYDFVREHGTALGLTSDDWRRADEGAVSRAGASALTKQIAARLGEPAHEAVVAFADAYLAEYGITAHPADKDAALATQRRTAWKSMGLDAPQDLWRSAGTDNPADQILPLARFGDTVQIGPADGDAWSVTLVITSDDFTDVIETPYPDQPTEHAAKALGEQILHGAA